ncbi:MAG TPA: cation-translocating P-type ATPase [Bacteroidia bacterium]|jgi:Ca2+-transporting ATPase|nr:cation-translocating P-type ATPase [Bacteroidia bacterium]
MDHKTETAHFSFSYPITSPHSRSSEELCEELSSTPSAGLSSEEAKQRLTTFGRNVIREKKSKSSFIILLAQFKGAFVILLFIAAVLSAWFSEWLDAIAILVVLLINALIGFLMEYKAERSMEALMRLTRANAKVIRSGKLQEIPSEKVVPGDILFAEAGDLILADARIIKLKQLQVDESALTGESVAVDKKDDTLATDVSLADRVNMLHKGTFVTKGNVTAIVTGTGMQTELGNIAALVQSATQQVTPLEKKISQFSRVILWITVALIVIIFIAGILEGNDFMKMLQTSIALAVAAIPEGLPIVTTLALAQGMLQMSRRNVIIKKLSAVETLGGTNVICTDKTGTLTQNKIEVNTIVIPEGRIEIKQNHNERSTAFINGNNGIEKLPQYELVQRIALLCNTAEISFDKNLFTEVGDPLETGLLKFVYSGGLEIAVYREKFPKIGEEPFASETKIMSTIHKYGEINFVAVKGAVEEVLDRCSRIRTGEKVIVMDQHAKDHWQKESEDLARSGLRMIAVAYKETGEIPEHLAEDLVFTGLIGLLDPPREDIYDALNECRSAGIRVIMLTGDHPETARNIGMKLKLVNSENEIVMHGREMKEMKDLTQEEKKKWLNTKIFARVTPKQKLDLVTVLQEDDSIVAMTGDGVNDAPALKKADIGIAMGQRGTQVAQDVADMILKDDSFSSIVHAIKQGRVIFENIRKFIVYLLSCNLSELIIISFSSILNLHYALFPLQILYINIVTDVLPALALGVTKGSDAIMKQQPRNMLEPIIDRKRWISIIVYSIVISACCLAAVGTAHLALHKTETWNPELCNNILFMTLIFSQLWHVFNMTTDNAVSFFRTDVFRNKYVWYASFVCLAITIGAYGIPPVAKALSLYRPDHRSFGLMIGFSLLSMIIIRSLKRIKLIL